MNDISNRHLRSPVGVAAVVLAVVATGTAVGMPILVGWQEVGGSTLDAPHPRPP